MKKILFLCVGLMLSGCAMLGIQDVNPVTTNDKLMVASLVAEKAVNQAIAECPRLTGGTWITIDSQLEKGIRALRIGVDALSVGDIETAEGQAAIVQYVLVAAESWTATQRVGTNKLGASEAAILNTIINLIMQAAQASQEFNAGQAAGITMVQVIQKVEQVEIMYNGVWQTCQSV